MHEINKNITVITIDNNDYKLMKLSTTKTQQYLSFSIDIYD